MTLKCDDRYEIVRLELERCFKNYDQARLAIEHNYWDLVANRLYYSIFHAISALLIHNGIAVKSHKGSIVSFHNYFVRTKIFTPEEGSLVSYLESKRNESDYNCLMTINKGDLEPIIPMFESIINRIRELCNSSVS